MCVGTDMKLSLLYVQEMENKMWLHIPRSIFFFFSLWYNLTLLQLWVSHTQFFI